MKRALAEMESRAAVEAICRLEAVDDQRYLLLRRDMSDPLAALDEMLVVVRAVIHSLRDAPHAVLDQARGTRLASGDAAVFWNAMIDAISPPEEA